MVEEGEGYALQTTHGAIVIAVNAERLTVSKEALSSPERVTGQGWPGDVTTTPGNVRYIFR